MSLKHRQMDRSECNIAKHLCPYRPYLSILLGVRYRVHTIYSFSIDFQACKERVSFILKHLKHEGYWGEFFVISYWEIHWIYMFTFYPVMQHLNLNLWHIILIIIINISVSVSLFIGISLYQLHRQVFGIF